MEDACNHGSEHSKLMHRQPAFSLSFVGCESMGVAKMFVKPHSNKHLMSEIKLVHDEPILTITEVMLINVVTKTS